MTDLVVEWQTDDAGADLAADRLWAAGATAVGLVAGGGGRVTLTAGFPTPEAARVVAAEMGARLVEITDDSWRHAWREFAQPVRVAPDLVVTPAWIPLAGDDVVEIDPGGCFGSGSHPSTRLILGWLARDRPTGLRVLDVGAGSGILAVAAARLGAASVLAVDIDPDAAAVTAANATRNGVAPLVQARTVPVADVGTGFDLALVNVTAGVHAELAAAVTGAVVTGGRILVAGLLPGQWRHVAAAYAGSDLVESGFLEGWEGAVLRRLRVLRP